MADPNIMVPGVFRTVRAEGLAAKARDINRYASVFPCPAGHVERTTKHRDYTCVACLREKERRRYAANKPVALEKAALKRAKYAERIKSRRAENKEKERAYRKDIFLSDPTKVRRLAATRMAKWTSKNREEHRARVRAYYARNREAVRDRRQAWEKANPEYAIEYRKKNKDARRIHKATRRARENGSQGSHTRAEILALLREQHERCVICAKSIAGGFHADHIVSLSRGGANDISNIQLLCASCNLRKADRDLLDFLRDVTRTSC